jgi:hypothetical protein
MKVAIVGSRTFNNNKNFLMMDSFIKSKLNTEDIKQVISGGANGADKLGKKWARINKIKYKEFSPDWNKYGKSAGMIRNIDIIKNADIVFAFWDGKSKGTKHSIKLANNMKKQLYIYSFRKPATINEMRISEGLEPLEGNLEECYKNTK